MGDWQSWNRLGACFSSGSLTVDFNSGIMGLYSVISHATSKMKRRDYTTNSRTLGKWTGRATRIAQDLEKSDDIAKLVPPPFSNNTLMTDNGTHVTIFQAAETRNRRRRRRRAARKNRSKPGRGSHLTVRSKDLSKTKRYSIRGG